MTNWNKLPYEIKLKIGIYLYGTPEYDSITKDVSWRHVNREFYQMHQNLNSDREFSFDFGPYGNNELEKLLRSPFQQGEWIKKAWNIRLTVPDNTADLENDPLYLFMECCPNMISVRHISDGLRCSDHDSEKVWDYFSTILLHNKTWKLEMIPEPWDFPFCAEYYFKCAFYMKESLTRMLFTGHINGGDYSFMSKFKNLKSLKAIDSTLTTLEDINSLISYLPSLEELEVGGFMNKPASSQVTSDDAPIDNKVYNNMKRLILGEYTMMTDIDLLRIATTFPCLREVNILVDARLLNQTMSLSDFNVCFNFLAKLETYEITMHRRNWDESLLLKKYYSALQLNNDLVSMMYITSLPAVSAATGLAQDEYSIRFSGDIQNKLSTVHLVYANLVQQRDRAPNVLANLDESLKAIKIQINGHQEEEVGVYIDQLFRKSYVNLQSCSFIGGHFFEYPNLQEIYSRGQHFRQILFKGVNIKAQRVLSLLSKDVPRLQQLDFDRCSLAQSSKTIRLIMEETSVDKLYISNEPIMKSSATILISIYSAEKKAYKYYVNMNYDDTPDEIGLREFNKLKLQLRNFVTIFLRFKSIDHLKLITKQDGLHASRTVKAKMSWDN